jgi:hypothetical protein
MKTLIYSLAVVAALAFPGAARADHDKNCKNVHGKITVVTEDGVAINDKMYKVGKSTRITKGDKVVKLEKLSAGDVVCLDVRGKDDIGGGEVAAVAVLTATDPLPRTDRQYVREETTVRKIGHDQTCNHVHGKVTRVENSTIFVDGKHYVVRERTRVLKDDQAATLQAIKTGDFVCVDADDKDPEHKVTTVMVLNPSESARYEREIIREKIREEK